MKVTDYLVRVLEERGVSHVFEMSGGMITHILDSLYQRGTVRIVSMHHEQAAAFAADAFGRLTGIPGVAMGTSGPGATNLLTGVGSCYFDSSPAVFITGQVNRNEQKGDRQIRQLGFQETDIVSMAKPITKAAWLVQTPEEIPELLDRAFTLAVSGRPGPVLVDIPMDVQRMDIAVPEPHSDIPRPQHSPAFTNTAAMEELFDAMGRAERPLILVGGGIRAARATALLRTFAQTVRVPVVNTLLAVDALPYTDPMHVGMLGSYGNRWANMAVGTSDFILVLGSRLDIRQTGADTVAFKGDRTIFHVDCDPAELNHRVVGCRTIVADVHSFLDAAVTLAQGRSWHEQTTWTAAIRRLRETWADTKELADIEGINPNSFMHRLAAASAPAAAYVVDVGQHQMWAAQSLDLLPHQQFLTSGGMGSMGFSLPASIGAASVLAPRPIVLIAGDGSFQSNIQELQTVARNHFPIKLVIINNNSHGMVRQFQQTYFDERYQSTLWGYSAPDFTRVSAAYRIPGETIREDGEISDGLAWLWRDPSSPALLQVMVDTYANVYPKMAFGRPITEMEPFATPIGMEGT